MAYRLYPRLCRCPGKPCCSFEHRQGPEPILPLYLSGNVSRGIPPPQPGEVALELDLRGSLVWLRVEPPRTEPTDEPIEEIDWAAVFELAGLSIESFEATDPTMVPVMFADSRMAWSGVLPDLADRPVRVEAASFRGKPVYFETIISSDESWSADEDQDVQVPTGLLIGVIVIVLVVVVLITGGALFLTVRNLRLRRGDRTGAFRIALLVTALRMVQWALIADHVGHPIELLSLVVAICGAVTLGVLAWVVYVAFEPYVRRIWPEAIVSWSRLLSGRFGDPLVGRDVLLGCTFASGIRVVFGAAMWMANRAGWIGPLPASQSLVVLRGGRYAFGEIFSVVLAQLSVALGLMMLFLLLRMILRKTWIAAVVMCLLQAAIGGLNFMALWRGPLGATFGVVVSTVGHGRDDLHPRALRPRRPRGAYGHQRSDQHRARVVRRRLTPLRHRSVHHPGRPVPGDLRLEDLPRRPPRNPRHPPRTLEKGDTLLFRLICGRA